MGWVVGYFNFSHNLIYPLILSIIFPDMSDEISIRRSVANTNGCLNFCSWGCSRSEGGVNTNQVIKLFKTFLKLRLLLSFVIVYHMLMEIVRVITLGV